jgi:nucleotide-binding universal stress UspA family protein
VKVDASVADTIIRTADEQRVDLIVLSWDELRMGPARTVPDGVTDAVVRLAQCPVLDVRRPHHPAATADSIDQTKQRVEQ